MFNTDFARTVTAAICALVVSATCVLGAVAPAQDSASHSPVPVATAIVA